MDNFSILDVLGPIMIGPSSSHTAGAAKIGYCAYKLFGKEVVQVVFTLHGSFAKTYKGHGTDKALLAGIMGIRHDDLRIRDAYEIAQNRQLQFTFLEGDLGDVHPNSESNFD